MTPELRLLLADLVRRTRWWAAALVVLFVGGMWWAVPYFGPPGRVIAVSMWLAFMSGPQLTLHYIPRAMWYLPVARRDIWRAGWLFSTIGVTAFLAAAKLIAHSIPVDGQPLGVSSLALSTLFDLGAVGIGIGLVIAATHPQPAGRSLARTVAKGVAEIGFAGAFLFAVYLAPWTGVLPPAHWSDLTAPTSVTLAAALLLTAATWFYVPTPLTPTNRVQPAVTPVRRPRPIRTSGLSGLPRLLLREAAWTFTIGGALAFGGGLIVLVLSGTAQDQGYFAQFLKDALRVADARHVSLRDAGFVAFNLLIWYAVFTATMAARFPLMLRHLRILPIGAAQLNALLITWPALIWLAAWAAATVLHFVVLGDPPQRPHAPSILALIGLSSLAQAASLRFATVTRVMTFATFAGLLPFAGLISGPPPAALAVFGIVAIAGAAVLNRMAFTNNATYRATLGGLFGAAPDPR